MDWVLRVLATHARKLSETAARSHKKTAVLAMLDLMWR
jgi:hypothetical protein